MYPFVTEIQSTDAVFMPCTALTDFDGDGHLGPSDLMEMLDYYTGKEEKLDDVHKERLVQEVYTHMTTIRMQVHMEDNA